MVAVRRVYVKYGVRPRNGLADMVGGNVWFYVEAAGMVRRVEEYCGPEDCACA